MADQNLTINLSVKPNGNLGTPFQQMGQAAQHAAQHVQRLQQAQRQQSQQQSQAAARLGLSVEWH